VTSNAAVAALDCFGSLLASAFLTCSLVVETLFVSAHHSPPPVEGYTKQIGFIGFIGKLTPNAIKVINVKDCA
jgi:hypothetical protein